MYKKSLSLATALVALAALMLAFSACSKSSSASSAGGASASSSSAPVTLTVWESLNGPDEFIKQAGEAYTKQNPNVTIKFVNVELGDSTTQIALDGPAGVGPDLFAAPHDMLGNLVSNGYVLPTANPDSALKGVLGAADKAITYDGTKYGYPVSPETYALYYNTALIQENQVPKTWEDLITFAKGFKGSGNQRPFMMDVGNAYYTIIFTTENNNRLFGPSGTDTTQTYLNTADAAKGMAYFQTLRKQILDVNAADMTTAIGDAAFQAGNVALYISGPWNVNNFTNAGIKFGVAALPSLPSQSTPAASFSGTRVMFVSAFSKNPDAANAFGAFLMTPEMQQLRANITNTLPALNVTTNNPYAPGFLAQLDYAFPMPSIPPMQKFWDAFNAASSNIWNGADVQKELDAANAAVLAK
ncbi:MAG: maltose ABC transporter substrate-binding protein [Spirochaetaceae bacterium]|jgi:arabinogalactan oligomer/maltooligosaccharide transport system substrate-binding protein|nr:maltose ABC transporter substrate-binding protein [Spirochaetaceae bacterium]